MRGEMIGMDRKTLREKVRKLDQMPKSVTSEEADLIAFIQDKLKTGEAITPEEADLIAEMHRKYFSPRDEEEEGEEADEDGVDEDDFV